ncbi:hypothetical protein SAMN02745166_01167 [Prosthecobacter debontii]|uniref:Small-conductance mechanosensitive channel n=2 Tax=Prosthecobacter debontii TaxID=48467 RepID=A0A1T4X9N3_9BACT|nr:hypothetical protein SAMN02745166_01167 [Prosthecobacter debontii]
MFQYLGREAGVKLCFNGFMLTRFFPTRLSCLYPWIIGGVFCISGISRLAGQLEADQKVTAPEVASQGSSRAALDALETSIRQVEADLKTERTKLITTLAPDEKEQTEARVKLLAEKRENLLKDLEFVVTGIDPVSFNGATSEAVDLQSETRDLLLPIVQELKQLTAAPREVEGLRREVTTLRERSMVTRQAVKRIEEQIQEDRDELLSPLLRELLTTWQKRQNETETELAVTEYKLAEVEGKRSGVFGTLKDIVSSFFKQRGLNLMLALLTSGFIFVAMHLLWRRLEKLPALSRKNRTFSMRLVMVSFHAATFLLSMFAILIVFYLAGDWVLLGVAILFLIGVAWTGKQTLPAMYEQVKLLLNLGSVREGERVIYNGLPWEVRSVGVFSSLYNPTLEGGHIRLPIRDLLPLVSRPHENEVWFPCEVDDWVSLRDGTHGKVVTQSPDWVQLVLLGGSRRTYPTPDFLELCPENLTKNFRVKSIFGIDYKHQTISTTEVPAKLKARLEQELRHLVGADHLKNVSVDFSEAASSSLNYTILADFNGSVAQKYAFLARAIQRICVDACNENHWTIPFSQITVHQGDPTHPVYGI